jgi:CspA family cold shock protein
MYKGKVISIDRPSGFGFIETDEGQKVFFHQRWLRKVKFRDLKLGDEMIFAINFGPRGPRAFNMMPASEEESLTSVSAGDALFKEEVES